MPLVQEGTPRAQVQKSRVAGYVDGVLVPSLPHTLEHLHHLPRLTTPDGLDSRSYFGDAPHSSRSKLTVCRGSVNVSEASPQTGEACERLVAAGCPPRSPAVDASLSGAAARRKNLTHLVQVLKRKSL